MIFTSRQIRGKGRGKLLGFPTINLIIPNSFTLDEGIYATYVTIDKKKYKGALHFGPIPAFNEKQQSLEVFLIDVEKEENLETQDINIMIETVKRIREIRNFSNSEDLAKQIDIDVKEISALLT